MSFSFSFVANEKRKKRTKRKRKHATASYALTSVDKMDVASRACTLSLAIGATHVNILSASISKIQNFIFSIQACLKVTFHVRTHVRGANVVHLMKIIMDRSALREGLGEGEVQNKNLTNNLRLEPSPENLSFAQLNLIFYPLPKRGWKFLNAGFSVLIAAQNDSMLDILTPSYCQELLFNTLSFIFIFIFVVRIICRVCCWSRRISSTSSCCTCCSVRSCILS